jgi:hypothetical protein
MRVEAERRPRSAISRSLEADAVHQTQFLSGCREHCLHAGAMLLLGDPLDLQKAASLPRRARERGRRPSGAEAAQPFPPAVRQQLRPFVKPFRPRDFGAGVVGVVPVEYGVKAEVSKKMVTRETPRPSVYRDWRWRRFGRKKTFPLWRSHARSAPRGRVRSAPPGTGRPPASVPSCAGVKNARPGCIA